MKKPGLRVFIPGDLILTVWLVWGASLWTATRSLVTWVQVLWQNLLVRIYGLEVNSKIENIEFLIWYMLSFWHNTVVIGYFLKPHFTDNFYFAFNLSLRVAYILYRKYTVTREQLPIILIPRHNHCSFWCIHFQSFVFL